MEKKLTENQLAKFTKKDIIAMYLSIQKIAESQERQLTEMNQKLDLLIEQLGIAKQNRFGRSTEKVDLDGQFHMIFNEAEIIFSDKLSMEPTLEEACPETYEIEVVAKRRTKQKGKRDEDLKGLPVKIIEHTISDEELNNKFGTSWRRLPDEVYKRLSFRPAIFEVEEHHVAVYCGTDNETIIKAPRPVSLLRNSIVTPSLQAAILNSKYVNAMPLYRIEQEFKRNGINVKRQVMANWTILTSERYLSLLYDRLHEKLLESDVCQADETTVEVSKDGRSAGAKSYMWVYRTGKMHTSSPIILYNYQKTRNASHPEKFLKKFKGVLVSDGYQAYHSMDKNSPDITVAGCWSHSRRRFSNLVKSLGKEKSKGTLAQDALKQISAIYKIESQFSELEPEERLKQRQLILKPLVEAFFDWIKSHQHEVMPKSETGQGFTYCLNQEKYLKVFLSNGNVPIDNNATEAAIRPFCVGRNNWKLIDTIHGAQASAIIYSIAETAKSNNLNPYHYFKYLLEEIPQHIDDKDLGFLDKLLPWSSEIPEECKAQLK